MVQVSQSWKDKQEGMLAPEGFVEISYLLSHDGLQEEATASSTTAAAFAAPGRAADPSLTINNRYAALEPNFWALDGSFAVLPDAGPPEDIAFVGVDTGGTGSLVLSLAAVHKEAIPGVTITWGEGWATDFTVAAKQAGAVVASKTITGNTSPVSVVELVCQNYDAIEVTVQAWSLPGHRCRIESVQLGYQVIFGKKDILSFTHSQTACLSSGELPKNSISFSLENISGRWNPAAPDGVERYLSDRQRMTVRYGFDIDGRVEWIPAGTFYLTEWHTPANGIEASFEARDILEYLLDAPYTGPRAGNLYDIALAVIHEADLPYGAAFELDAVLQDYEADFTASDTEFTQAQVLQLCANAACCVLFQKRDGTFFLGRRPEGNTGAVISRKVEYAFPEFALSKPLKSVEVTGGAVTGDQSLEATSDGEGTVTLGLSGGGSTKKLCYTLETGNPGEKQTVNNELIQSEAQAAEVANWVANNLKTRKTVSGEYRADPRLDALDAVTVETRFGTIRTVILTGVTYTFGGAFRGKFTGYVPASGGNATVYYAGEIYSGEVSS